jgi:hypothetical protein
MHSFNKDINVNNLVKFQNVKFFTGYQSDIFIVKNEYIVNILYIYELKLYLFSKISTLHKQSSMDPSSSTFSNGTKESFFKIC